MQANSEDFQHVDICATVSTSGRLISESLCLHSSISVYVSLTVCFYCVSPTPAVFNTMTILKFLEKHRESAGESLNLFRILYWILDLSLSAQNVLFIRIGKWFQCNEDTTFCDLNALDLHLCVKFFAIPQCFLHLYAFIAAFYFPQTHFLPHVRNCLGCLHFWPLMAQIRMSALPKMSVEGKKRIGHRKCNFAA